MQFVASLHFAFVKTWHKRAGPLRLLTLEGNIQLLQQFYWEQHLFLFLCVIDIELMHYLLLKLWYIPWKQWSELVVEKIVVIDVFAISQIIWIHVFFFQLFCTQDMRVQKMMGKLKSTKCTSNSIFILWIQSLNSFFNIFTVIKNKWNLREQFFQYIPDFLFISCHCTSQLFPLPPLTFSIHPLSCPPPWLHFSSSLLSLCCFTPSHSLALSVSSLVLDSNTHQLALSQVERQQRWWYAHIQTHAGGRVCVWMCACSLEVWKNHQFNSRERERKWT